MQQLMNRVARVPRNCVWEITRACDLRCAHCGTGAGRRREDELTTDECVDVARQLAALGTRLITLSGGEPTLREDWPVIARAAGDVGVTVNMVTNGQARDPAGLARQVHEARLSNVGISIDGDEAVHDELRKAGAYARATRTIATLAEAGIWVDVMVTVNRRNLDLLPEIYDTAAALGARGFRAQLGKPMGNQTDREDLTLRPRDMLRLLPALGDLAARRRLVVNVGDSVGYFSPQEKLLRGHRCAQGHWTGCWAGVQAIGIQSDGGIKGCLSLQPRAGEEDPFLEGNLHDASLATLWNRPGAFAYNREHDRDDLGGACASCGWASVCRGGARCVSYACTGRPAEDPLCYHAAAMAALDGPRRRCFRTAAAAAAAVAISLATGCSGMHTPVGPGDDAGPAPDAAADADGADASPPGDDADLWVPPDGGSPDGGDPDAALDAALDCEELDCDCFVCNDYGDPDPGGCEPCGPLDEFVACCCEDVSCSDPCPDCDYGFPSPLELACRPYVCNDLDYGDPDPGNDYGLPRRPPEE